MANDLVESRFEITLPSAGVRAPVSVLSRVVFPEPEGPVTATKVPRFREMLKFLRRVRFSTLSPSFSVDKRGRGINARPLQGRMEGLKVSEP